MYFYFFIPTIFGAIFTCTKPRASSLVREPATEPHGTVAVFKDLYGNCWDLRNFARRRCAQQPISPDKTRAGQVTVGTSPLARTLCRSVGTLGMVANFQMALRTVRLHKRGRAYVVDGAN